MRTVVLSLGSNVGDRQGHIRDMVEALRAVLNPPVSTSRLMETEPVDVDEEQPWYFNLIVSGGFAGTAQELHESLTAIENRLGRVLRGSRKPRTADIDILLYGDECVADEDLVIPHPRLVARRFCIIGMNDINSQMSVPGAGMTVGELVARMPVEIAGQVVRFVNPNHGAARPHGR